MPTTTHPETWSFILEKFISFAIVPFFILCFAMFFCLVFKDSISQALRNFKFFQYQGKDKKFTMTVEPNLEEEKDERKEAQLPEKSPDEEKKEEIPEVPDVPRSLEDWRTEMIIAYLEKDRARLEKAYKNVSRLNSSSVSKKEDDITYLEYSHALGDTEAIRKLQEKLDEDETLYKVNAALGFCYFVSDNFDRANSYYQKAIEFARNEEERSISIANLSESLYRNGEKEKAIESIVEGLSAIEDSKAKVRLYRELADLYDKEKNFEQRAFVLDKALELQPNDSDLLFKSAYAYSQSDYDEMSLLHYGNANQIDPTNTSVRNNLGVQYDKLGMPIRSAVNYKEAERLGETLASANLAYRLMDAGFAAEAEEKLKIAKSKDEVHPNVGAAISALSKKSDDEDEVEKKVMEKALQFRKFVLGLVVAKFSKGNALRNIPGSWKSKKGTEFQFSVEGNKVVGFWKEKIITYDNDYKLEGEIFNNSVEVTIFEKYYSTVTKSNEFREEGKGALFCDADCSDVWLMRKKAGFREKHRVEILKKSD